MDYSRQGVKERQKDVRSTTSRLASKFWIMVLRILLIVIVGVGISGVMAAGGAFEGLIDTAPTVQLARLNDTGFSSTSYYSDGTVAQVFAGAEANRVYATIDEIPLMVQHCFVAIEDERFYEHGGIDIRGIFRAGVSVAKEGELDYGASTITQQILKNVIFGGGKENNYLAKIKRKIQEQYLAIQVESVLSKDQILEYYLNYINLGNGNYGIKTAAEGYFGKELSELTLSEAAVLAPIAHSPTFRNPITHPADNAERRQACLDKMLELGWCTQAEYDEAVADDVYTRIAAYNDERKGVTITTFSYFTDELVEQVLEDFQKELGYTAEQAQNLLYYGGISIYTTQDKQVQDILDKYYTNEENFPAFGFTSSTGSCYELSYALSVFDADGNATHYQRSDLLKYYEDYVDSQGLYYHENGGKKGISELLLSEEDINAKIDEFRAAKTNNEQLKFIESKQLTPQPQSSFSIIEQSTGKVVAVYGGRGEKKGSLTLNRATNTVRQVGSTFKVLASFLPAIDGAGLTLASVQDDIQYFYPGTGKEVINWYGSGFRGLQSIRTGIYNSLNIVAVKTLEQIGAPLGFEYLQKLGFSTLVKNEVGEDGTVYSDVGLPLALGGLTKGVTNLELTAAYASIANGGIYNKPLYYTKILDSDGNVILEKSTESKQVMKTSTAWLLTSAMLDTTTIGTASRLSFKNYKMPVAGKTGTASKDSDLWFVGYTPYYTASVWTGYDHAFDQKNKNYHQEIWRKVMEEIHETKQLPYATFEKPDSIVQAQICTKCGNLAVIGLCDEAEGGSCVKTEYFAKGTVPTQKCNCHIRVDVCKKSNKPAGPDCPKKKVVSKVLLIKNEYYKINPRTMQPYDPPEIITTWDTPYIYHPDEICDKHLPDGAYIDEEGNIVYGDEDEEEGAGEGAGDDDTDGE
ncbi:MAG: transglycosylase domain-containing protein [Lachnospiraceae bacterium]|nr:transglycosylase domain-containing protein [Lachnospiraceae bacterium]